MKRSISLLMLFIFLVSCTPLSLAAATPSPSPVVITPSLPPPHVAVTSTPSVQETAKAFLDAWVADDYHKMYGMLSRLTQDAINEENFTKTYREAAIALTLQKLNYNILSILTNPQSAQVAYNVTIFSALTDEIQRQMMMSLTLEGNQWKVQWEVGMVLPELTGGNTLKLDLTVPARGNIYDIDGNALVTQTDAYAFGVIAGQIFPADERNFIPIFNTLTGKDPEYIRGLFSNYTGDWYTAIGDAPASELDKFYPTLSSLSGIVLKPYKARYYFGHGIAPQTIGYAMAIPVEELELYKRRGYRGDERVGMSGIEKWSENDLMGQRGADLYVVNPQGQTVTRLAQKPSVSANSIYTTIDPTLQEGAQKALSGFRGAIVVLESNTGRVLAMVSAPDFDPNLFEAENPNSALLLGPMLNDGKNRLLNRAAQGGYPLGSVFKIITMAAALESGQYTAETKYYCANDFKELPNLTLYDWTYTKGYPPSGELTLPEGLMRSCNPYFWHIGLDLYRKNLPNAVSEMARSFGLGKPTGIGQIAEDTGNLADPANEGDAVQLAIGQGTMLSTPLQVAVFTAALGNGGTLYRPQVIEKITSPDNVPSFTFQPQVNGTLPIKPETLRIIQGAMRSVVANERGTAYERFTNLRYKIYGKTGTAQNSVGDAHAWFAGYSNEGMEKKPDIAVVVIAENAGEGSEVAAPIFRRVIELYFNGRASTLYPWEYNFGVPYTPTPLFVTAVPTEETPAPPPPQSTPTPQETTTP